MTKCPQHLLCCNLLRVHCSITMMGACRQEHVQTPVKLVCFNLGYFPGGDKGLVTKPETTVAAIQAAMALLQVATLCAAAFF